MQQPDASSSGVYFWTFDTETVQILENFKALFEVFLSPNIVESLWEDIV